MPSRLPYSPLPRDCAGADSVSEDVGRMPDEAGRLAGLLGDRRAAGRDLLPLLERDIEPCFGMAARCEPVVRELVLRELPLPARIIGMSAADFAAVDRDAVPDLRADVERDRVAVRRAGAAAAAAIGFAEDMVLAAVISALAAVVIALVAVFIDCMADDIVLADAVALVAAAVILLAADVTLVAADETPLAAVAGVAELRLAVVRRVVLRLVLLRLVALRVLGRLVVARRAAVEREADVREAVDREAVLRVDRDAELRGVARLAVLPDAVALLRLPDGRLLDFLELDVVLDRLAVPRDALRVTGLLRAELAELRRFAARVVDLTGTDSPPVLINYEECYSTHGEYLHTRGHDRPEQ